MATDMNSEMTSTRIGNATSQMVVLTTAFQKRADVRFSV